WRYRSRALRCLDPARECTERLFAPHRSRRMLPVSKASSTASDPRLALLRGQVVSTHGRHYLVEVSGGEILTCFPRGKRSLAACGDLVQVMRTATGQGVIEAVDPRRALLYRSDQHRQKLIAANVT